VGADEGQSRGACTADELLDDCRRDASTLALGRDRVADLGLAIARLTVEPADGDERCTT
jgi:hypothetical protein